MQFLKQGDFYKIARNTGNTYNYLAVSFSKNRCDTKITSLSIKKNEKPILNKQEVFNQVILGLSEVNKEFSKKIYIKEIQFIPSDTKPEKIYSFLVQKLIKNFKNDII